MDASLCRRLFDDPNRHYMTFAALPEHIDRGSAIDLSGRWFQAQAPIHSLAIAIGDYQSS
jgi:hypothetical protein